ncbi:MAG: 16S rRNA (cytidine(1402)-2'-O)-methyltransferase [Saprospiraceae bacterium]|nr:16S rRNA (cytidine(1402)-2'-O)-methyltransferase [Saprospiraceae bacterium]MBK6564317.1 16S rRNA (cytidine(1402)-2'-O)-methyltransferase [Saprospiraceae bacterium]MBK7524000.1 16S rRNA (cytidine(1402)-2'-O)-methyltransferase [Saprospiraceae bacterium]MBK8079033.1 16S rRNA (cytidine(1402)-2'-O)-methyltransferase [Saprospiraceae bacterium]MBK8372053.1 16S rRNA (cytidine(1402)-2'-O)-methyltransferase [Saprospiraceae bacterium]
MLYLVPTPIGHLEDITLRAISTLKSVDLILAEDTRTSGTVLKHYEITTPVSSYHAFNEHKVLFSILSKLKEGKKIALITDAGTPGISDPGFLLVRECVREGIKVSCLPGPVAFIPVLVSSGLPCDSFYFEGFLPHKKGRQTKWKFLSSLECTFVLYESPHRLIKCLEEIKQYCGEERELCVGREISKMFEEIKTDLPQNLIEYYTLKPPKGEIVIVVSGLPSKN